MFLRMFFPSSAKISEEPGAAGRFSEGWSPAYASARIFHISEKLYIIMQAELQKDYFHPVSEFLTRKCPDCVFGERCHNMKLKSIHRLVI